MTTRYLSAVYARRPAPKAYDPDFLNVEMARVARAMPSFVVRRLTASASLQINDGMVVVDASAGAVTVSIGLPSIASGQPVTIKKSDATANVVTIGGTVDGVVNRTLLNQNDSIVIQSDGSVWFRPMLTASGAGGGTTTFALGVGAHLAMSPDPTFNGSALETITTDGTSDNTVSTLMARDATGNTAASNVSATSVAVVVAGTVGLNILEYSQELGASVWAQTACGITSNTTTAPDATTTADLLTGTGTDANIGQTLTSPSTTRYTFSVYLKWGNASVTEFGVYNITTASWMTRAQAQWTANVVTGLATAGGSGGSYVITAIGSGWYRVSGTTAASVTLNDSIVFLLYAWSAGSAASGKTVYAWGTQLEAGTALSAYAPTTTVTTAIDATGKTNLRGNVAVTGLGTISSTLYVAGTVGVGGQAVSTTTALAHPAGVAGVSSARIPSGVPPTSPVSGDVWSDTKGLYYRANTTTVGPLIDSGPVFLLMGG